MTRNFGDEALIYSWMRNRNTVEFLGIWEQIHNPEFKGGGFETFKMEAGQWREANPKLEGNMREYASIEQLLVLANIEGMNAEFIRMGLPQGERLTRLNQIAIRQMQVITASPSLKGLGPAELR